MGYIQIDDEFFHHPMIAGIAFDLQAVYLASLCHCAHNRTVIFDWCDIQDFTEHKNLLDLEGAACFLVVDGLWRNVPGGFALVTGPDMPHWTPHPTPRSRRPLSPAQAERNTRAYRAWRAAVLERDDYRCAMCGETDYLHVHHNKSFADNPEWRLNPDNGITLCADCHSEAHGRRLR
jgi:hypothetical protein